MPIGNAPGQVHCSYYKVSWGRGKVRPKCLYMFAILMFIGVVGGFWQALCISLVGGGGYIVCPVTLDSKDHKWIPPLNLFTRKDLKFSVMEATRQERTKEIAVEGTGESKSTCE